MSGLLPAGPRDLRRVWRTVKDTGLFADERHMREAAARRPFRLLVGGGRLSPRIVVARPWRADSPILAVQFLAAAPADRAAAVEAIGVAAALYGFALVLSPMVRDAEALPFIAAGYEKREEVFIMALQALRLSEASPGAAATSSWAGHLRQAEPGDIEGILAVDRTSFDDFWAYGRKDLEELMDEQLTTVAVQGAAQVVGYTIGNVSGSQGNLVRLAVAPGARRRGIASALVADAAAAMRARGAKRMLLCTQSDNDASQRLYARLGFTKVGPSLGLYIRSSQGP